MSIAGSAFEDEMDEDYREWEQETVRIEKAISLVGRRDLSVLGRAGVDRKVLLTLLALAARSDRGLPKLMRQRQAALKSLSRRLETLAEEARERVNDPLSVVQFWAYINVGKTLGMPFPKAMADDPGAEFIVAGMRTLAKIMSGQAAKFGDYLRTWGKTDIGVALLLARYRLLCPKMEHLDELARLLTDAFEAAGKNRSFSADGLRKTYKRRAKRLLRLWIMFAAPTGPPPPAPPTPIAPQRILDA